MKSSRIREMSMEVTVGAFMFMILLALGVFTIILSRQSLFTTTYYMDIRFEEVLGIREGDNVFLRGVTIGKVKRIQVQEAQRDVLVRVALDRKVDLREDYRIEILPSSVLGGRYLHIYEGSSSAPPLPPDQRIEGVTPVDLIDQATRTVQMIKSALDEGGVLQDVKTAMANINDITTRLKQGDGTIGKLLVDDQVYRDLRDVADNLKKVSDNLAQGKSTLGRFLADDAKMYDDLQSVVADLKSVSERLAAGDGLLGKLMSKDDTTYQDLQEAVKAVRDIAVSIDKGEGTIGKLVRDDSLYEEARLLVNEGRATLDDFRETAPITTFTSVLFGAF